MSTNEHYTVEWPNGSLASTREQAVAEGDPDEDDRPPICPACGVTMGIVLEEAVARHVCLECGYPEEQR